jgi:hypothetical protein
MALSKKTLSLTVGGLATDGFASALTSGRSVAASAFWGLASAVVEPIVLWLAMWTSRKPPS